MNLTQLAIRRPTLMVVIYTVLVFLGLVSYRAMKYELMPDIEQPVLVIATVYPGASPSEVENSVTKKIEDAVSSLEDIDNIKSTSYEGLSISVIIFTQHANMNNALRDAQKKVSNIVYTLPKDALDPIISDFKMSDFPVMRMGLTAQIPPTELYDLVRQQIQPMLSSVQGVAQIYIVGGEEREIKVNMNADKLAAYGLSSVQVLQAIQRSNMEFPTGKLKAEDQQVVIRLAGKIADLELLRNQVVATTLSGQPIYLKEVADVEDATKEIANISRINGVNSVSLMIMKKEDGNEVNISKAVKEKMTLIETMYKDKGVKFTMANDTADFTLASANAVSFDLLMAIFLVAMVMLVFLHSLRNSLIILVAIPTSLITTFIAMNIFGFSLNIISLVAMSLVIGILVDDSIVVLENIYRHLEMGKDRRTASLDGRMEIGFTALSITLVDVVVFLPIAVIDSMISEMLRQFALVVVFSTLISLFVSFTLTPLLASRFAKLEHYRKGSILDRITNWFEKRLHRFTESYSHLLVWVFHHKALVLISATILFLGSVALIPLGFIGSEFVTMGDRGEVIIQFELPKNVTIKQTNEATLIAEEYFHSRPEVVKVFSTVGSSNSFFENDAPYKASINVKLVDKENRPFSSEEFAMMAKRDLTDMLPGVKVRSSIVSLIGTSDMSPIQLVLTGPDLDTIIKTAETMMSEIKKVPGTSEVRLSVEPGMPEVNIRLDEKKMAELGLSTDMVGATMQTAFQGNSDSKFRERSYEYGINIVYDEFDKRKLEDVRKLVFTNTRGQQVQLDQFSTITASTGMNALERKDRVSSVTIMSNVVGLPVGTVGEDIMNRIGKMDIPEEITITPDGDLKYQNEAFGNLLIAFLASILFVYLIMVALYESYLYPFVVLFSIPLAIIGALLALALTMQSMTIFSILGIIMLVGLVGKNAILLVDFTNQMKREGHTLTRSLIMAGKVRMRPILMTTLSMIFGMMPIALATGPASEWKNGMAWALIGGLTSSLLLTLVVVPVIYLIFDGLRIRLLRWRRKSGTQQQPVPTIA